MRQLRGLEGAQRVEKIEVRDGYAIFSATVKSTVAFSVDGVRKRKGRYIFDRVDLSVEGTVSRDDHGLLLAARDSGQKIRLRNRKDGEDVAAAVDALIKAGRTLVRVGGEALDEKDGTALLLSGVVAVAADEQRQGGEEKKD